MTKPMDTNPSDRRSSGKSFEPARGVSPDPGELASLMDCVYGIYAVTTQTAVYELDLDRCTIHRRPRMGQDGGAQLRRDAERIDLVELLECTVGMRMYLLIDLHVPGVDVTARISTRVASIVRLNHSERR